MFCRAFLTCSTGRWADTIADNQNFQNKTTHRKWGDAPQCTYVYVSHVSALPTSNFHAWRWDWFRHQLTLFECTSESDTSHCTFHERERESTGWFYLSGVTLCMLPGQQRCRWIESTAAAASASTLRSFLPLHTLTGTGFCLAIPLWIPEKHKFAE